MKTDFKKNAGVNVKKFYAIFILFIILLLFSSSAQAHKVYLFAWTEGDMIHTESYFSGNKKIQDGTIKVFDSEGKELVSGKTNEIGEFSFKIPEIADLRIVLESSMGHGAEYLFKKSEFSSGQVPAPEIVIDTIEETENPITVVAENDKLYKEIEVVLDEKLKPVIRELTKLREEKGPGVTEIVGGIGYILGIMGIIAYMKSRKE